MEQNDLIAYECAQSVARGVFHKLPNMEHNVCDVQDLAHEFYLRYWQNRHTYDSNYSFLPWVCAVMRNEGIRSTTKAWQKYKNRIRLMQELLVFSEYTIFHNHDDDLVFEWVNDTTPETILLDYVDTKKAKSARDHFYDDVKILCNLFDVAFDIVEYSSRQLLEKLATVIYKVKRMKAKELALLPAIEIQSVFYYQEVFAQQGLQITNNGGLRNIGLKVKILECLKKGMTDNSEIYREVSKSCIVLNDNSFTTILSVARKELFGKGAVLTLYQRIENLFNSGVQDISAICDGLVKLNIRHSESTVRQYLRKIKRLQAFNS